MPISLEELKFSACKAIDDVASHLNEVSQEIWNHPELNFEEKHAHKVLTESLEENGFPVTKHYVIDTAFKASYGSDKGPHVAVLCEYDALPEIGHACGHNLIAEVGLGAGIGIKAALEMAEQNLQHLGKVTVIGTPAEEGGGGKIDLLKADAFKDVDVAIMAHPFSLNVHGYDDCFLALQRIHVTYHGKASHAAAFPWEGINALDAAVLAYQNISCLRQQMKPSWRVHGIISNGGAKPNIIPEESSLIFLIRCPTKYQLDILKKKCINCFEAAAKSTGCSVDIEIFPKPYDNMMSNKKLGSLYDANARSLGLKFSSHDDMAKLGAAGSTDMGNVSHVVPSIHPMFYIGGDVPIHTRDFTAIAGAAKAQQYAIRQAKALATTALDVLWNADAMEEINVEFEADIQNDK